jgi:hypothetical protein
MGSWVWAKELISDPRIKIRTHRLGPWITRENRGNGQIHGLGRKISSRVESERSG